MSQLEWWKRTAAQFPAAVLPNGRVRTTLCRLSFPHLFTPQKPMAGSNSEPRFSATLLLPPGADLEPYKAIQRVALAEKFGADFAKLRLELPIREQGEKDLDGYTPGSQFFKASSSSDRPPVVTGPDLARLSALDKGKVYAGCYVIAVINAYAWEYQKMKRGASFGLLAVQKVADGPAFGGGAEVNPDDVLTPITGAIIDPSTVVGSATASAPSKPMSEAEAEAAMSKYL